MNDKLKRKVCKVCGVEKNPSSFTKDSRNKDSLGAKCKECFNARQRELYPKRRIKRPRGTKSYEYHRKFNKEWLRTFNGWLSTCLHGCRQRHDCSLTKQDVIDMWERQGGLCAITGQLMDYEAASRAHNRPSIDRIDNSIGYHIGNVRLVWHWANQAKNTFTDEQLFDFCKILVENFKVNEVEK